MAYNVCLVWGKAGSAPSLKLFEKVYYTLCLGGSINNHFVVTCQGYGVGLCYFSLYRVSGPGFDWFAYVCLFYSAEGDIVGSVKLHHITQSLVREEFRCEKFYSLREMHWKTEKRISPPH